MANGTRKATSEVREGDYVYATDPETGESGAREVIATLPHTDQLLTLRLSSGEVVTTEDHKYWNATDHEWQESQQLDLGDELLTADGDVVTVEWLDWSTVHNAPAYDLDVADLNSFYVGAGDDEVLVHNQDACKGLWKVTREGASRVLSHNKWGTFYKSKSDGLWWAKDKAGHGGSTWKVFKEQGDGLHWYADADEFGDFMDKHKSAIGEFIPWKDLHG